MTSNRGAGFSSVPNRKFDPLGQSRGAAGGAVLTKKTDATSEEQAREMEKKVHELLEESALLCFKGDPANGTQGIQADTWQGFSIPADTLAGARHTGRHRGRVQGRAGTHIRVQGMGAQACTWFSV